MRENLNPTIKNRITFDLSLKIFGAIHAFDFIYSEKEKYDLMMNPSVLTSDGSLRKRESKQKISKQKSFLDHLRNDYGSMLILFN